MRVKIERKCHVCGTEKDISLIKVKKEKPYVICAECYDKTIEEPQPRQEEEWV